MNIIEKIILFIKNIFIKRTEIKKLEAPKVIINEDKKDNFIESLKVSTIPKIPKKPVETLICTGDGLGIQKKITS